MDQQDRRILQNEVSVVASASPVSTPVLKKMKPGMTICEIVESFGDFSKDHTKVYINGDECSDWSVVPKDGDLVSISQTPKEPGTIAAIAIVISIASIAYGYYLYSTIEQPNTSAGSNEKLKRITGARNEAKPYEPIPVILGERRVVPAYAAQPYTYWVGNAQYLKMLLCVGHGPLEISDIKIGDNPIDNFSDVKYEVLDWYNTKSTSKIKEIWNADVQQDTVNVELDDVNYVERAAPAGTNKITLNYTFPAGLFRITGGGSQTSIGTAVQFQYKVNGQWYTVAKVSSNTGGGIVNRSLVRSGDSYWIVKTGNTETNQTYTNTSNRTYVSSYVERVENGYAYIRGQWDVNYKAYWKSTKKEFYDGISFTPIDPSTGNVLTDAVPYRVRTIPCTPYKEQGAYSIQLLTASYELNSYVDDSYFGINESRGLYPVLIALDIRASDQLSNTIDNLSCKARSLVPNASIISDWKGWNIYSSSWKVSNNPAEMYKWVLQGHFNPVAISNDRIDTESLQDWYDTCEYRKWETNEIVNYDITLKDLLSNIAFTGRAFFTMREGKFGVIENIRKDNPVQIFTPKNSSGLTSRREFELETDGIKYTFANAGYEDQEDEGYYGDPDKFYNSDINSPKPGVNITGRYDDLEVWGTTNPQLARKHARFAYFEKKLRREVYQLDVDIESLTARRGDKVLIASDTIDVGLGQGFIQEIEANRFRVDETINLVAGNTYSMTVRSVNGGIVIQTILAEYQGDGWWEYSLPSSVAVGDLVSYGNVLECLVTEIQYNDNYSATLTLVNYADDLYSVDFGALPTYESKLNPVRDRDITPLPPVINVSEGSYVFESNSLSVNVTQDANDSAILSSFTLQYRYETQNDEEDVESDIVWFDGGSSPANIGTFNIPVSNNQGNIIVVRAQSVNTAGVASAWTDEYKVVLDNNPAPDVEDFTITETVDEPKTPDAKWSTLTIEITPPSDESRYLYAIAEYRQVGQEQWYRIGTLGWKNPNSIDVQVYADGRTYEVRIRSVSIFGVENTEGISKTITTTNTSDPSYTEGGAFEELPAPNVTGLELFEQGNDTEFTGKDAKFTWRKSSIKNWVDIGYEGLKGASSTALDQYFRDYQVDIIADNEIVRTEYVTDNSYIYTYEKNAEDYERRYGVPGAYRSFRISVIMRTRQNQQSERAAVLDVENPAPEPLSGIEIIPGFKTITVRYNRPTDLDYEGVEVWVGEGPGFDLNDDTLVYDGPDTEVTITGLESGKQYYIILRPYDAFGKVDIFSTELTTSTLPIKNTDIDSTPPDKVENVFLSTGVYDDRLQSTSYIDISWNAVTNVKIANYTLEINGGTLYTVAGTSFRYTNVIPGENYTFRVRANSFASIEGQWSNPASIDAAVSSVQPTTITNASVSGGLDKCIVTWANPTSENFYSVSVHRGSTSLFTPSNANKIASVVGAIGSSQTYIDSDVVNDTTYHYKLVPETLGGVSGAEVYAGAATPNRITPVNIDDYLADTAIVTSKIADGAINLSGNKITGQLQGVNLADAAVDTDKLADLSITASKLVDGSVEATKIANLAVGTAAIANGAITNAKIANLDASKITTGTLDANRIGSNTITTDKLVVSDLTNLCVNPVFEGGSNQEWTNTTAVLNTDSGVPSGAPTTYVGRQSSRDSYCGQFFPVNEGEKFYIQAFAATPDSTQYFIIGLHLQKEDGTNSWRPAFIVSPTGTWTKFSGEVTVPSGYTKARVWASINAFSNFGNWYYTQILVLRKVSGELIVDGAITADKIAANSITAGSAIIADSAITSAKIGDLQVTNAKIANLDAAKITTGTLNADRIGANTITAGKLNIGQLSAITADMGSITAGTITSGTTSTGVQLSTTNGIRAWSSGTQTLHIKPDGTGYIGASQDISWDGSGNVSISGELGAGSIFTNGRVTSTVGNINVGLGPIDIDGTVYLMWGYDASASVGNKLKFGIDELGNAYFKGDITGATGTFSGQLNVNNNFVVDASGNVDSSGTFRFGGATENYIEFDGTNLTIDTPELSIDSTGNAAFSGQLLAAAGVFGNESTGEYIKYENGIFEVGPNAKIGSNVNRTVTVGVGGDFATINSALEYLSRTIPAYKPDGFTCDVLLLSGFVIQEQVFVRGIDLSWITISSQSPSVDVDGSMILTAVSELGHNPVFCSMGGGKTPNLKLNLNLLSMSFSISAYSSVDVGSVTSVSGNATNFGYGVSVNRSGEINIREGGDFSGNAYGIHCDNNSEITSEGSIIANDCGTNGVFCNNNSRIYVSDRLYTNSTSSNTGVNITNNSQVLVGTSLFSDGDIYNKGGYGIYMSSGSELRVSTDVFARRRHRGVYIQSGCTLIVGDDINADECDRGISVMTSSEMRIGGNINADNCISLGIALDNNSEASCPGTISVQGLPSSGIYLNGSSFRAGNYVYANSSNNYSIQCIRGSDFKVSGSIAGVSGGPYEIVVTGGSIVSGQLATGVRTNILVNQFNANGIIWDF